MILKFKKLHPEAVVPEYAKKGDAGLDLTAVEVDFSNDKVITYHIGLAVEIPEGFVGLLFPRSSVYKKDLSLANSVGVIDSGYRGEIMFKYKLSSVVITALNKDSVYDRLDRVGQLVVLPIPSIKTKEVDELSDSDRGEGGFGSTDSK